MAGADRKLRALYRRVRLLNRRGVVTRSNSTTKMQTVQVKLTKKLTLEMEHFEPFGSTSKPMPGAEAIVANIEGKSNAVCIVVADRKFRFQVGEDGEQATYNAFGDVIHLSKNGIVITSDKPLTINAPSTSFNGDVDITGTLTNQGKNVTTHNHQGDSGGSTGPMR